MPTKRASIPRGRGAARFGGNKVYHDWHYLLGALGLLDFDTGIGYIFFGVAGLIFITAILMPLIIHD